MAFKVDSSFLRFVTMGALGTRSVMDEMRRAGLKPIELERYSCCNKIWATKVKRLRLPDLLCLRTGLRIEVRAKSKLEIKMSDAPNNAARQTPTPANRSPRLCRQRTYCGGIKDLLRAGLKPVEPPATIPLR